MATLPVIFFSHGAGPMMFLESSNQQTPNNFDKNSPAAHWFRQLYNQLAFKEPPKAILIITAHWETSKVVEISAQSNHTELLYDYYNFPPEAYQIQFQPRGDVELAKRVRLLLNQASIPAELNDKRDFDHGVFVPLKLIFPKADIPVVSLSILDSLSPTEHLAIGKALAPLRNENVLILGSGASIHGFRSEKHHVDEFLDALIKTLTQDDVKQREEVLINFKKMLPHANSCHPREEHLIPLHVIVGAAGTDRGHICNPSVNRGQVAFQFGN